MRTPSTEVHSSMTIGAVTDARLDRPTTARVELAALTHNFRTAEKLAGGRHILAVVKAQAYGHGAVRVARHLVGLGAHTLGVALVEEGRELREAGIASPIVVMGALFPGQAEALVRWDLTPAIYTPALAEAVVQAARAAGKVVPVHVKVDTGMGRIGILPEAAAPFLAGLARREELRVEGIMTHFADADLRDKQFASRQMERFTALLADLDGRGISLPFRHAANSAAVLDFSRALFTMVRPGLMLYGYSPLEPGAQAPALRPVLSLVTRIAYLKKVPPGTPVSYGRTFVTKRESLIATVPIGYADGYSRSLSNRGEALVCGRRVPVAGRVCMDMTMLDVTDVTGVSEGDEVVLIGAQGAERITADDIAAATGTISYEVLCGISSRVPRVYVE